jgi:hypothetical protein
MSNGSVKETGKPKVERVGRPDLKLQTRVFDLCDGRYSNLCELARAMGISLSQIYRVRQGKRRINEKFVTGAIRAFPNRRLDELFYLGFASLPGDTEGPAISGRYKHMIEENNKSATLKARSGARE